MRAQKNTGAKESALDLMARCARARCGCGELEREMVRLPCSGVVTGGASAYASACACEPLAWRGLPGAARVEMSLT